MAVPRTLIGGGIGAALGAGAGAATSGEGKRKKGAAKGAVLGGVAGVLGYGVMRTRALPKNMMASGRRAERAASAARAAPSSRKAILREAGQEERLRHAFLGSKSPADTVKKLRKSNPFQGASPAEAKKLHRSQARALHPDRGGDPVAFKKMQGQYETHKDVFGSPTKRASVAIDSDQWDSFWKEAMTAPAMKAFKSSMSAGMKNMGTSIPGKMTSLAKSSGKGQTAVLGRSGVSGLASPPPPRITV